jgi:protein ImuB
METRPLRTLALWCPDWPVTAAAAAPEAPVAILEGEGARRIVTVCSPAARARGVRRGQRIREAQRHCPHLVVYRRDEAREAREFEPVVAAAEDLATSVEVVRPGLITVDVRGPARYHGGEERLAALLRAAIADLTTTTGNPIGCGMGIADGPFAATLAAHAGILRDAAARNATPHNALLNNPVRSDTVPNNTVPNNDTAANNAVIIEPGTTADFLAPYPVTVLDRPELARSLTRLSVRTLGSFAALPDPDVAGRFGVEGVLAHRLAQGLNPRPLGGRRSIDALSVAHEFDPPAKQDEAVAFVGRALANRLHLALAVSGVACVRLGIDIVTASGRGSYRLWRHGGMIGGRLSALAIAERIRWQLDGWRAREPYPTADPVVALRLVPDRLVVDTAGHQAIEDLWDPQDSWDAQDPWGGDTGVQSRVERAVERVEELLGPGAVRRPRLADGHDPVPDVTTIPWREPLDSADHARSADESALLRAYMADTASGLSTT